MLINGKKHDIKPGISISKMLEELNLSEDKVVVEVNINIVPKDKYSTWILNENDTIEVVSFVGGG